MTERRYNVLFLCTGNSARSIMAEATMNRLGGGRFRAFSAGSHPAGTVHSLALETLRKLNIPADGLRSKGWDEFAAPGAPPLDFVFTVCDKAAGETCPVWPGQPITAHWGVPDPVAVIGSQDVRMNAFKSVHVTLSRRIELFLSLPLDKLDRLALQRTLTDIGDNAATSVTIELPVQVLRILRVLGDPVEVLGELANQAFRGVVRPGSPQRPWVLDTFGDEWLERLERDPALPWLHRPKE